MHQRDQQTSPTAEPSRSVRGNGPETMRSTAAWQESLAQAKDRVVDTVQDSLIQAKHKVADTVIAAQDKSRQVMDSTSGYVQRWPFSAIAVAIGVGVIVGFLLGNRGQQSQSRWPRSW